MPKSSASSVSSSPGPFLPPGITPDQLLREIDNELGRRHLYAFSRTIAPPEYVWGWHHELLYDILHQFAVGDEKRVIIEMPPGHGKSEGCSRNLPAYLFGINPDSRVIACSYTQDLAGEMNRDVQRIMDSPRYQEIFPGRQLGLSNVRALAGKPRRNSDVFDIPGHRGIYKAAGIGVGIGGRRFDRGIIDDPIKDREEANSPAHRERVWRWFTSVFWKRQAKNAGILITSTRWHEDDLVGRIKRKIAEGTMEPWTIVTLQSLATDNTDEPDTQKPQRHPLDRRAVGEALWPWFRSAAEHERAMELEPRDFFALDQQDPRAEGGTEFAAECFPNSIWFDDWPKDVQFLTIALDPSKGRDAAHGDYSALVSVAKTSDGMLWVEGDLARRDTTRMVNEGIEFADRMRREIGRTVDGFGCEANQFQELLADQFIKVSRERGFMLPIFKITNTVSKDTRIRRLTPFLTSRNIRFRATPGTRLLVRQLQQFPVADHDDGPDALEMALRLAIELWNGNFS
jgi:predicted phage terminase large subunit-like protein